MTIREIETASGMTRANIRFYESEGLLNPERRSNGYRDYTEEDLEILERIRLLRFLHVSLDDIKAMQSGERALLDVLSSRLVQLQAEQAETQAACGLCEKMKKDGVQYQTLNARRYLKTLEETSQVSFLLEEDAVEVPYAPFRRLFARLFDASLYFFLWEAFLLLVLHINTYYRGQQWDLANLAVVILLTFLLEPLQLSLFGTTIGKAIFGLQVKSNYERRLTYQEALARTKSVFFLGLGLCIPIWNLVRLWKSYQTYKNGETLEWDYDSVLVLKDRRKWRIFVFAAACAALFLLMYLTAWAAELPRHRGNISTAQFCENYNQYAKYYQLNSYGKLDSQGHWISQDSEDTNIIYVGGHTEPHFLFTEENGEMTGMEFHLTLNSDSKSSGTVFAGEQLSGQWVPSYTGEMALSILSFVKAQSKDSISADNVSEINRGNSNLTETDTGEADLPVKDVAELIEWILENPYESFSCTINGIRIDCEIVYSGYTPISSIGMFWQENGKTASYSFSFSMQKK